MGENTTINQSGDHLGLENQWSDWECTKIALEDHFPNAVKDKNVQKNIIVRFLNFYLGARVQKGIDIQDIVYSTISIMPLHEGTEDFIFKDPHYNKEGTLFFLTPEEKLQAEVKKAVEKSANVFEKELEAVKLNKEKLKEGEDIEVENNTEGEEIVHENNSLPKVNDEKKLEESTESSVIASSINHQEPEDSKQEEAPKETKLFSTGNREQTKENVEIRFPENIRWFTDKRKRPVEETNRPQYGPVTNAAFIASCNKLLDMWNTSERARINLKYFFGVVALTLMRATTKTYKHLVHTFSSKKFLNNLPELSYIRYSVPHKKCLKSCYRTFSRRDGNVCIMFAKLVVNSYYIDIKRNAIACNFGHFARMNIFKVTVLAHTANYGLGLLSMVETICDKQRNENLNIIVEETYCDQTAESWRNLHKFIEKYMVATSKESTHYWARVINREYFKNLCCTNNYSLSVILSVFIEKITGTTGIWQSTWVGRGENLNTYKELGLAMYKKYALRRGASMFESLSEL